MLFKFYIYLIILCTFILSWICISFYTALLLTITLLTAFQIHDHFVPVDGVRASNYGNDWGALFNLTGKPRYRRGAKAKMFKNWNPFRKKTEKDSTTSVKLQSYKQEPVQLNKENSFTSRPYSSPFSAINSESKASPRPITLSRRGSLKVTRLKPVSENSGLRDSHFNRSSFNSSFKSERSGNDVSIFNASGPLLSSPFIPQVKQALGINDTLSPLGTPNTSRSRVKRSNTFHYAPSHPTTPTQGSLPVVRLGRRDRHSFREQVSNSPNTVKIAPPDVTRFPTCRLSSIRERTSSSNQAPDTQAVVTALKERRKRSYVQNEESVIEDVDSSQQSKRRRQESTQSTASSASLPAMPDHLPDLSESGYTLMPIESAGVKRPAAPSREQLEDHDTEVSLPKRPKKENRNDPIKSSLRSSRLASAKEGLLRKNIPIRRHSINVTTKSDYKKPEQSVKFNPAPTNEDLKLRSQPTVIIQSDDTVDKESIKKSNNDLFNEDTSMISDQNESINSSMSTSQSKRLLFDGVKQSTKKRQLSLYPSLNTSFKAVPVANVLASAEDYEKDREDEQKRVTDMLKEITEEHESKNKKEEMPKTPKLTVAATISSSVASSSTATSSTTSSTSSSILSSLITTSSVPTQNTNLLTATSTTLAPPKIALSAAVAPVKPQTLGSDAKSGGSGLGAIDASLGLGSSVKGSQNPASVSSVALNVNSTSQTTTSTTAPSTLTTTPASGLSFKPVFGAPASTTNSSIPSGATGGFSFGGSSLGSSSATSTSQVTSSKTTAAPTAINFGNSLSAGLSQSNKSTPATPNVSLNFGANQSSAPNNQQQAAKPAASGFSFGLSSSSNQTASQDKVGFGTGLQATPNPVASSSQNTQGFGFALQSASNPSTTNASALPSGFGLALQAASNPAPTSNPTFGSAGTPAGSLATKPTASNTLGGGFSFGQSSSTEPTLKSQPTGGNQQSNFAFGQTTGSTTGGFSFGGGTAQSAVQNISALSSMSNVPKTDPPPYPGQSTISGGLPKPTFNFSGATSNSGFNFGATDASKPAFGQNNATPSFSFGQNNQAAAPASQPAFGGASTVTSASNPFTFSATQSAPTGSSFGMSTANPTFASNQPAFGNKQGNAFGASTAASPFGSTAASPFGSQPSAAPKPAFGSGAFGSNSQSATPSGSVFGSSSGSVFGTASPATNTSFGQNTSTSSTPFQFGQNSATPSNFQFGQTTPAKPTNSTPGFNFSVPGGANAFAFGSPSTSAPVGTFGTPSTPVNPFNPGSVPKPRAKSRHGRKK